MSVSKAPVSNDLFFFKQGIFWYARIKKEPKSASIVLKNYLAPVHNAHFRRHAVICLQCNSGKVEKKEYKDSYYGNRSFQWNSPFKWRFGAFNWTVNQKEAAIPSLAPTVRIVQNSHMGQAGETPTAVIRNNRFYNLMPFFTKAPVHLFNFNSLLYL